MKDTPRGMRRHIALLGKTNAGKSTLFNLLTGQENAIVSEKAGTTTDPVIKSMELLPFGPVALIDTAGLEDTTELGRQRMKKTMEFARRADIGLIVREAHDTDSGPADESFYTGEKIYVFTKCDLVDQQALDRIKKQYPGSVLISHDNPEDIDSLKRILIERLTGMEEAGGDTLIGDLLPRGGTVVMVVPVDSGAPKGRLILPQVQLIRDCLDYGIKAYVTRETELESALGDLPSIELVVTDSQVFAFVNELVPADIPLTSFSMLLARQKGNFKQLLGGTGHIKNLKDNDRILMLEACTHNHTHEDIGRVKIPGLLNQFTGKRLEYVYCGGYCMPDCLDGYSMAVLCGSCMINKKELTLRLKLMEEKNIPVTNYGIILAYLNGILDRCTETFK